MQEILDSLSWAEPRAVSKASAAVLRSAMWTDGETLIPAFSEKRQIKLDLPQFSF